MPEIIEGMDALQKQFRELEFSMQRQALLEAATAGGEIVRQDAANLAPKDSGALANGIVVRPIKAESDINEGAVEVGFKKKVFYGIFQEGGTAHHKPQPFLGPAFERNLERIGTAIAEVLGRVIDRIAA